MIANCIYIIIDSRACCPSSGRSHRCGCWKRIKSSNCIQYKFLRFTSLLRTPRRISRYLYAGFQGFLLITVFLEKIYTQDNRQIHRMNLTIPSNVFKCFLVLVTGNKPKTLQSKGLSWNYPGSYKRNASAGWRLVL